MDKEIGLLLIFAIFLYGAYRVWNRDYTPPTDKQDKPVPKEKLTTTK